MIVLKGSLLCMGISCLYTELSQKTNNNIMALLIHTVKTLLVMALVLQIQGDQTGCSNRYFAKDGLQGECPSCEAGMRMYHGSCVC